MLEAGDFSEANFVAQRPAFAVAFNLWLVPAENVYGFTPAIVTASLHAFLAHEVITRVIWGGASNVHLQRLWGFFAVVDTGQQVLFRSPPDRSLQGRRQQERIENLRAWIVLDTFLVHAEIDEYEPIDAHPWSGG